MVLSVGERLLLTTNAGVSAVELPAACGAEVQHYLTVRTMAGPVIALPGAAPRRWLLLTESADEAAPVNVARLHARGVQTHRCGTLVPLPPSHLASGLVKWQVPPPPGGPVLPPFDAVVTATRAVTETVGLAT
ncbi:hypothetical protein ACQPW3_34820 [Actinosynnema sp. CA-248983]